MKNLFIITAALFLSVPNAYAQESDKIINIIREDGTQERVEIKEKNTPEEQKQATAPAPVTDLQSLIELTKEPKQEQDLTEETEPEQKPEKTATPKPEEPEEPELKSEEPVQAASSRAEEAVAEPLQPVVQNVPKPAKKPAYRPVKAAEHEAGSDEHVTEPALDESVTQEPQNNAPIPESMALSIAIDNAPPADDFQVFKNYQGDIPIYQVLFRTGGDIYEVQVGAFDGIIIYSGYREDLQDFSPKAGHLPRKWSP